MIGKVLICRPGGTQEIIERELLNIEYPELLPTADEDIDAMLIDHEYRLTLLELGITE